MQLAWARQNGKEPMVQASLRGRTGRQPQPAPTLVLTRARPEAWVQGCVQVYDDVAIGGDLDWEFAFVSRLGRPAGRNGRKTMATKRRKREQDLPVLHPDAAGIDVGASELFVAVPAGRSPEPVRSFPTFTKDLHELGDWLQDCGIHSVAMESTSVYWIPVYQILEARGIEVFWSMPITSKTSLAERATFPIASGFNISYCPKMRMR
jgi:hypothetical protein